MNRSHEWRAVAQSGRALEWGSRGRWFESNQPDKRLPFFGGLFCVGDKRNNALHLCIDGLNMDAVYESLVRQIAGDKLQTDSGESLKASVERDEKKKQLEKQISALENKMRKEKQLNRRMEMNAELKRLNEIWKNS